VTLDPLKKPPLQPPVSLDLEDPRVPVLTVPEPPVPEPVLGTWVFEVAHPLNSDDNMHDINAQPGDIIGLSVAYWDMDETGAGGAGGYPSFFQWDDMLEYQIAGPPMPDAIADLTIQHIEVTQAVQDDSNTLPLARRKTTVVRVFIHPGPVGELIGMSANVFLYARDPDTMSSLPGPLVDSTFPKSRINRNLITESADFLLPTSWVDRDHLELTAYVTSNFAEINCNNNWLVPTQQFTLHKLRVLNIYEVPINTGTAAAPNTVSDAFITAQEEAMRAVFPMEINFVRLDWTVMGQTYSGNFTYDRDLVIAKLNEIVGQLLLAALIEIFERREPSFPLPDLIYGYHTTGGGRSNPTWYGGQGFAAVGYLGIGEESTMAHECTHNLDRSPLYAGTWGCHPWDDPNWPYEDVNINEIGVITSVWPTGTIYSNCPDYMSYSARWTFPKTWISPYRWNNLLEEFEIPEKPPNPAAKSAGRSDLSEIGYMDLQQISTQALQVSGWLEQAPKGAIESILQVGTPDIAQLREYLLSFPWLKELVGDIAQPISRPIIQTEDIIPYEIAAIGPDGSELYSISFLASFISPDGEEIQRVHFTRYIPMDERLSKGGYIELRVGGKTLATQNISPGVPEVTLLTPIGGEKWRLEEKAKILSNIVQMGANSGFH